MALSIQLINQRLPAPTAAAAERSSSCLNSMIRRVRASSLDTLSSISNTPWNKEIPLALAVVCSLWQLLDIKMQKKDAGPGAATMIQDKYALYLIAFVTTPSAVALFACCCGVWSSKLIECGLILEGE